MNPDHRGSFWKTWLFCILSLILPLCSADIPLKWVPSYCRCCVQISSCLWLRRKTHLKEKIMGLWVFFIIIISLKCLLFFLFSHLNKKSFHNKQQNFKLLSFTIKAHLKDQFSTGTNFSLPTSPWIPPPLQACSHTPPEQRQARSRSVITTSALHSSPPPSTHCLFQQLLCQVF